MKVLYFGTYDPDYPRNRVLIKGLIDNGVRVLECRDSSSGIRKFINLFRKHRQFRNKYDVMIVGFLGQTIVPFAKLIARKPIVFDAFLSLYDSNVFDRKTARPDSIRAGYYWFLDWLSMKLADIVLFDTNEHIDYASNEFGLDPSKFRRIFVGTDNTIFYSRETPKNEIFTVHFHGSFIPLQGIDYIIKAAKLLKDEQIQFNILGRGQTYPEIRNLAAGLGVNNIDFIDPVNYDKLPEYINRADICLGIFGKTPKAQRVVPNKVYEYAAMAKPIITMDTPAIRELFDENDLVFLNGNDPQTLADAILILKGDRARRSQLAQNAYQKFISSAKAEILGKKLKDMIRDL